MMQLGESFEQVLNDGDNMLVDKSELVTFFYKEDSRYPGRDLIPQVRLQQAAAGKYLMKRGDDYDPKKEDPDGTTLLAAEVDKRKRKRRLENKAESERLTRGIAERYRAEKLKTLIKKAEHADMNVHDFSDAFLGAIQKAIVLYKLLVKKVLPRRKRGEKRSDMAPLTAEQMKGGTIRVVFIDPGFYNIGLCMIELLAMQLPPADAEYPDEPEPIFRILLLQLVDARQDWDDKTGHAKLVYDTRGENEPYLYPDYELPDIRAFFFDREAAKKAKQAEKRAAKKAAAAAAKEEDDDVVMVDVDDEPSVTKGKKKKKNAKTPTKTGKKNFVKQSVHAAPTRGKKRPLEVVVPEPEAAAEEEEDEKQMPPKKRQRVIGTSLFKKPTVIDLIEEENIDVMDTKE
jgi:hypothetical protein